MHKNAGTSQTSQVGQVGQVGQRKGRPIGVKQVPDTSPQAVAPQISGIVELANKWLTANSL